MNDVFEHAVQGAGDGDMLGVAIRNEVNQNDRAVTKSFGRREQLSVDMIWSVFERVAQSNATFNALDALTNLLHFVGMPLGFRGRRAVKSKGRPLSVMGHIKTSIIEVKAETKFFAHALAIAVAKATNDPNYNSYRRGYKIRLAVQKVLTTTGFDLSKDAGIAVIERFQEHLQEYKIVVNEGFNCDNIMFEGRVDSSTQKTCSTTK
jgi:hypothetical protein